MSAGSLVDRTERRRRAPERKWGVLERGAAVFSWRGRRLVACSAHTPSLSVSDTARTVGKCRPISRTPGMSLATTGSPAAQLSRTAPGRPSHFEGNRSTSTAFSSRGTSARSPANITLSSSTTLDRLADARLVAVDLAAHQEQPRLGVPLRDVLEHLDDADLVLGGLERGHVDVDRRFALRPNSRRTSPGAPLPRTGGFEAVEDHAATVVGRQSTRHASPIVPSLTARMSVAYQSTSGASRRVAPAGADRALPSEVFRKCAIRAGRRPGSPAIAGNLTRSAHASAARRPRGVAAGR